ncbi:hypothetical protein MMC16_006537 [Acarospora aff. strigata]|nr:hypothetical protein [Acarospora aff. strigata]
MAYYQDPEPFSLLLRSLSPPQSPPPLGREDLEADQRPILERENEDDGPPPIRWSQRNRLSLLLPPAPPTSRGTSFDEPLCTQNARSSADLWVLGLLFEQRLDTMATRLTQHTHHRASYPDAPLMPDVSWDEGYDSRATLIESYNSSSNGDEDYDTRGDDTPYPMRRPNSSTDSSFTYETTEEEPLTPKHRNFATEDLRSLDDHVPLVKESSRSLKSREVLQSRLAATATKPWPLVPKPGQSCDIGCRECLNTWELPTADSNISSSTSSPSDHLDENFSRTDAYDSYTSRPMSNSRTAEGTEAMIVDHSVWEEDEASGTLQVLASSFHLPATLGRGRRRKRLRARISRYLKGLSCCSTVDES